MRWLPAGMLVLLALGFVVVPLAAVADLPGERPLKELVGMNPDGCAVVGAGPGDGWRAEPAIPTLRDGPAAAVLGDGIYLVGGIESFSEDFDRARSVATFERFDTRTRRWTTLPPLPQALNHVAFAAHDGALYAFGGNTDDLRAGRATARSWRFSLADGAWAEIAPLPTARGGAAAAVLGARVYVAGGRTTRGSVPSVESYDTRTGTWRRHADLPTRRDHLGLAAAGGRLYAAGGRKEDDASLDVMEVYDPAADAWSPAPGLPEPKAGFAFLETPRGLVAAGGEDLSRWTLYGGMFRFLPGAGRWEALDGMAEPRHGFGAAFAGGRLFVLGGSRCSGFLPDEASASIPLT